MRLQKKLGTVATLALMAAMFAAPARGQVLNSGASPIALQAVLTQSISVTLSGNAVNFNLVAGSASNPGSASITATEGLCVFQYLHGGSHRRSWDQHPVG